MNNVGDMSDTVLCEDHGGWLKIILNRPDRLNSLNVEMHLALRDALDKAADSKFGNDTIRAVLITGAGRGFCAGQDLGDRNPDGGNWPPDLEATLNEYFNPLVRRIKDLPMPVICAVNGVAAGAGANVALACDIVLAAESARFIQAFSKVGLVPDAGGSWLLPNLVGQARAMGLALTGEALPAPMAAEWGMIWKAYPDDKLIPAAEAMTAQLAAGPTLAYAGTKALMQQASTNSLSAQLDAEAYIQQACGVSDDYAEGVRAFLAKRPAQFSGR
tara:strand:- start:72 stop:890 length:819 start_codon:yes stop_codon:yes gene_type:complete